MVKHIVMWKVKGHEVYGTKDEVMQKMKERLEALKGEIEGLESIEVGINYTQSDAAYDIVLNSVLTSKEALEEYRVHPKHVAVANGLIQHVATARVVVDYEI